MMASKREDFLGIQDYKVVGTRPIRHDGVDKVTGRALYGADVRMAGLLHGKVLRSPNAHARIRAINASRAKALPGVKAVITGKDLYRQVEDKELELGEEVVNVRRLLSGFLATEKVLFQGHPVAAVAAIDPHVAEEALDLIDVDYEILPHVLDAREAMKEDAPLLHEDLTTTSLGESTDAKNNNCKYSQYRLGDVEKGFARADVVIEREFSTVMVHQGYIEPQNATALWNPDGQLTIWCSSQGAFGIRDQLAEILGIPVSKIRVIPMEIGGGFGGKVRAYLEPLAAVLSRETGRPVKIVMTRTEVLQATGPTPGSYIRTKMGADEDGRLVAAYAELVFEAGAFPGTPISAAALCMFAPYDIENVFIETYEPVVNKTSTSAYRAPGATNGSLAAEIIVDEICEAIDVDPLAFRLKNSSKEGSRRADGPTHPRIGHEEVVKTSMESDHYMTPLEGPNRGRGVASGFWPNGGGVSSAVASVNKDGTVGLVTGSVDIGGTRTACAMQLAEVLGIPAEDVKPTVADTDAIGYTGITGGSRTCFATGWAAFEAAHDIRRQMIERAATSWEISQDDVAFEDGTFRSKSDPSKSFTFRALAEKLDSTGGPVTGRATARPSGSGGAFAQAIVDVEADPDTGKVEILRATMVQDAGTAIYPGYVEGQMQGGMAQGIGWALNEEFIYNEKGELTNPSFLDYRMPTSLDLPMIESIIVEVPNPGHPYGARGVGEVSIVPPPAAVSNAIYRALGVRLYDLPMSPARILEALWKKNGRD